MRTLADLIDRANPGTIEATYELDLGTPHGMIELTIVGEVTWDGDIGYEVDQVSVRTAGGEPGSAFSFDVLDPAPLTEALLEAVDRPTATVDPGEYDLDGERWKWIGIVKEYGYARWWAVAQRLLDKDWVTHLLPWRTAMAWFREAKPVEVCAACGCDETVINVGSAHFCRNCSGAIAYKFAQRRSP